MSKLPRSAAQQAAGRKFAAAGRAAQARSGRGRSAAQKQAALKWAAAGRASQKAKKTGKHVPLKPLKRAATAPEILDTLPGFWLGGCNIESPVCPAVAIANSLLACTGIAVSDSDIMRWHREAGGQEDGAVIANVLETLYCRWIREGSNSPEARLIRFCRTDENMIIIGSVLGLRLPHDGHAVLAHPRGMVSWGRVLPFEGIVEEAWALEWELDS